MIEKTKGTRKKCEIRLEWRHRRREFVIYVRIKHIFNQEESIGEWSATGYTDDAQRFSCGTPYQKFAVDNDNTGLSQLIWLESTSLTYLPFTDIARRGSHLLMYIYISSCSTFLVSEGIRYRIILSRSKGEQVKDVILIRANLIKNYIVHRCLLLYFFSFLFSS